MKELKEKKVRIPVSANSKIIGKTISEIEKKYEVCILELENTSDRAFLFSWETKPDRSITIKSKDEIVIFGKMHRVEHLSRLATSLN